MKLRNHFSHNNIKIMKASIKPQSKTYLDTSTLKLLTILYNLDHYCVGTEAVMAMKTLGNCELQNAHDDFVELL